MIEKLIRDYAHDYRDQHMSEANIKDLLVNFTKDIFVGLVQETDKVTFRL